jgi:transposase
MGSEAGDMVFGSRRAPQHPELAIWCSGPGVPHSIRSWRYCVRWKRRRDKKKRKRRKRRSGTFVKIYIENPQKTNGKSLVSSIYLILLEDANRIFPKIAAV